MKRGDLVAIMDKAHGDDWHRGRWGFVHRIKINPRRGTLVSVHIPSISKTRLFYTWALTFITQEDDHAAG